MPIKNITLKLTIVLSLLCFNKIGFAQVAYPKGRIVLKNDSIIDCEIYPNAIDQLGKRVKTKIGKKKEVFDLEEIHAITIKGFDVYQHLIFEGEEIAVAEFAKIGDLRFYKQLLVDNLGDYYFKTDSIPSLQVLSNRKTKISLEDYKIEDRKYKLPSGKIIVPPVELGGFKKGKKAYFFDGTLYELQYKYIDDFKVLGIDLDEKNYKRLSQKFIKKAVRGVSDHKLQVLDLYPSLQYAIVGTYTAGFGDQLSALGLDLEFRFRRYLPNLFFGMGYVASETFETRLIGCTFLPGLGKVSIISPDDPVEVRDRGIQFRLGYYLAGNAKVNPYLFVGTRTNRTSTDRFEVGPIINFGEVENPNDQVIRSVLAGAGIDYFVVKYVKTRLEAQYYQNDEESGFQFRVGLGFWIQ